MLIARLLLAFALPPPTLPVDPETADPPRQPLVCVVRTAHELAAVNARLADLDGLGVTRIEVDPAVRLPGPTLALAHAARPRRMEVRVRPHARPADSEPLVDVLALLSPGRAVVTAADALDPSPPLRTLAGIRLQLTSAWRSLPIDDPAIVAFERLTRGRRLVVVANVGPDDVDDAPVYAGIDAMTGLRAAPTPAIPRGGWRVIWWDGP